MEDKRIQLLEKAPIPKAVNKMAAPAVVGLLVMAIYNLVDTMFVAWIGTKATGATQIIFPIIMLASAIGLAFGIGGGSYLSRLIGKKEYHEAEKLNSVTFFTGLLLGVVYSVVAILFIKPILTLFGATAELMPLTKAYALPILLSGPFLIGSMVLNNLLRSEGSAKLSMIGMATGAVLNIILDPIFIFVCDWGVTGASAATAISQVVSFSILLSSYLRKKTLVGIRFSSFKPSWAMYGEILKIGTPVLFKQVLFSISFAFLNQTAVAYGGTPLLAAAGIITRVTVIPFNIIFGIGQGFQPVAGYNFGSGNKERLLKAFRYTLLISAGVMAVTALVFLLIPGQFMKIFKAADLVSQYGARGLRYSAVGLILFGISNTITVFYQAIGRGVEAFFLSITRQGIFYIPLIFILPRFFGIDGALMSQAGADIVTFALSLIFIIPFLRQDRLTRLMEPVMDGCGAG